jgi:hypothetical protein
MMNFTRSQNTVEEDIFPPEMTFQDLTYDDVLAVS